MKVKQTLIIIGVHGTVRNGLVNGLEKLEIEGRAETIQTTVMLRILRRILETWGDAGVKKLARSISSSSSSNKNNNREEEDLPALKTALTHPYNDSKTP